MLRYLALDVMDNSSHVPACEDGTDRLFRNVGI